MHLELGLGIEWDLDLGWQNKMLTTEGNALKVVLRSVCHDQPDHTCSASLLLILLELVLE